MQILSLYYSVMIVVAVTALVLSIDKQFPVVVLILAESTSGEIDLMLQPGEWEDSFGLNATGMTEILTSLGSEACSICSYLSYFKIFLVHSLFSPCKW